MLRLVRIPPPIAATSLTSGTVVPSVTIAREFADPRLELLRLLHEACEIEHSLMIQYLYAAFSIRPQYSDLAGTPDPKRSDCVLGVAVQEMRHLGHVNRLLVQLGGQPNMARQDFPYESQIYPFEMKLERLTRSSLAKYVYAEAPAGALKEETLTLQEDKQFARDVLRELREEARFNHIGTLYQSVLGLLDELAAGDPPPGLQEMRATVLAIRAEGEGGHFEFFKKMFLGTAGSLATISNPWEDPQSEQFPSFAVPENPTALVGHPDQISDPRLLTIAQLGNLNYWIVLSLLHLTYEADRDLILGQLAVSHMTGALYPLCASMSRAGSGMPFDPLSLGYRQGLRDQGRTFVRWLLEESLRVAGRLIETDKALAELCHNTIKHSLHELDRTEPLQVPADAATVIGAGPAGLAAACSLASRGIPVFLLEKANLVAGKVHSFRKDNRSIEHGVHGWWTGYLNFNRLLEEAGVNLDEALKEAEGSNLIQEDGNGSSKIHKLKNYPFYLPSPLHLFIQTVLAPYLRPSDTLRFLKFGIHLLAFRHERDYRRYDGISFQQLMDDLKVPPRIQHLILQPFILSFDFAIPERVSAACGLSGSQFYVLPTQRSILTRWSKGLPAEKVFGPLVNYFKRSGGSLLLDSPVQSISIVNNRVQGLTYQTQSTGSAADDTSEVIAEIPLAQIKEGSCVPVASTAGRCWILCTNGNFSALSARCTHQGCDVDWVEANRAFLCPCHGGRYDAEGKVLQGPPPAALAKFETLVVGNSLQVIGSASTETILCQDVILAADTHAAQQVLRNSPGLNPNLVKNIDRLGTTPVIVVRLWFESLSQDPQQLESAITPDAVFIDNFFMLNSFSNVYNLEGAVLEVQSYRVETWLDRSDDELLKVVFRDLATFCPDANRGRMKSYEIQRHRALFTAYAPGRIELRPGAESGTDGLFLAGDWTEADWSVWMMERAIVSGLRAANAVLLRRGLQPIEIQRLPKEGLLLRISRRVCESIRRVWWKSYPSPNTQFEPQLDSHE
jgi:uncharacterized protein with NAD-binding domain and iron-sulfur cluster/rubrerythrin